MNKQNKHEMANSAATQKLNQQNSKRLTKQQLKQKNEAYEKKVINHYKKYSRYLR